MASDNLPVAIFFFFNFFITKVDQLTLFPFPGLKIINIRGSALLTLDLIIINHFVTRLQPENQLLELSLRDQVQFSFAPKHFVSTKWINWTANRQISLN